jgi:hypothetical protein
VDGIIARLRGADASGVQALPVTLKEVVLDSIAAG